MDGEDLGALERHLSRYLGDWYALPASFAVCFGALWTLCEPVGLKTGWHLFAALFLLSLLLAGNIFFAKKWLQCRQDASLAGISCSDDVVCRTTSLDDAELVREKLAESHVIRIFASGSENYHTRLKAYLAKVMRTHALRFQVLVRDDGTDYRREKLADAHARWKELDELFGTRSELRTYSFDVMYRGVLWSDDSASLGWYERRNGRTVGQEIPLLYLDAKNGVAGQLLKTAADYFDRTFAVAPPVAGFSGLDVTRPRLPARAERELVVFDLDGTIYDAHLLSAAFRRASLSALKLHARLQDGEAETLFDESRREGQTEGRMRSQLQTLFRLDVPIELVERAQSDAIAPEECIARDDVLVALMRELHSTCMLAIFTNITRPTAWRILEQIGFEERDFDIVLTGSELRDAKPSTRELERLLSIAKIEAGRATILGDREHIDLDPAEKIGMQVVPIVGRNAAVGWLRGRLARRV